MPFIIGDKLRLGAVRVLIIRALRGDLAIPSVVLRLADFNFTLRSMSRETTGPLGPGIVFLLLSLTFCGAFFRVTFSKSSTVIAGLLSSGVEHFLEGVLTLRPLLGVVGVIGCAGD